MKRYQRTRRSPRVGADRVPVSAGGPTTAGRLAGLVRSQSCRPWSGSVTEALRATVRHLPRHHDAHAPAINRLNVYPVPDGDTGTNMARTLDAVVAELDAAPATTSAARATPSATAR